MRAAVLALLAIAVAAGCVPDAGRPDPAGETFTQLSDAEDARPSAGPELQTLLQGLQLEDPFLRGVAVRALGRLERPDLGAAIIPLLGDPDPDVRSAAADALAHSVRGTDAGEVIDALRARVPLETDAGVRGTVAQSLGRLRVEEARLLDVEEALVDLAGGVDGSSIETLSGVALGFESLTRGSAGAGLSRDAADLLVELMALQPDGRSREDAVAASRVRALASQALGRSRRLTLGLVQLALADPEPEVRRVVIPYLGAMPPSAREGLVRQALADTSAHVATEAVRYLGGLVRTDPRCAQLIAAAGPDAAPGVRISALEALAAPCPTLGAQREILERTAQSLEESGALWQPAAQALLSLAEIDAGRASRLLPAYVEHASPFVRTYAARTAAEVRDVPALFALALDPSRNVRAAAVPGLFAIEGHGLDDFLVELLDDEDPQLLMTVAGLLDGARDRGAVAPALLTTFERISGARRETWRDARLALLERIAQLGEESLAARLLPFLKDYDPRVAAAVVEVLQAWTGGEYTAQPEPLPRAPVPGLAETRTLERSTLRLHMSEGGTLSIELMADQALTNVARTVRLASDGYYDGLTFHRWAPNFVIQGGSPAANEYQGDGPYTRDETGGLHWRGTVGVSTRGRDTGDGQIFINLVDNPRLNHDYTVIGRLVDGYDVLDAQLEGAVIERAEVVSGR